MNITVNGKAEITQEGISVSDLLTSLGYNNGFVAVAINQDCVPRSQFSETTLKGADDIEILAPMSGG